MYKNSNFMPIWTDEAPRKGSYRSIFKWGDPNGFKHPNQRLYSYIKDQLELTDDNFKKPINEGHQKVVCDPPVQISNNQIKKIKKIVGIENLTTDGYSRVKYSSGMTIEEIMKLRDKQLGPIADIIVHPRNKQDIQKIVIFCNKEKLPIYVYGGGSSVNFGHMPVKGGITLVMNTHMNKIVKFNEIDQTVQVQPGMMGPDFEKALNNAKEKFRAEKGYTCGHFPQSFEFSSVGGWVVTLGSGQASSYYGDAYDLVVSQEYITPVGNFKTHDYPAAATGPKINDIMKGNEGSFGVLVELTMKIFKHTPKNQQDFAFVFPNWEAAVKASREICQGEFGMPAVFRISDPEETVMGLKLYGVEGTFFDKIMRLKGFKPMERCLCIGHTEGEIGFSKHVKKMIKKICKKNKAMYLTGLPLKNWRTGRYTDPYMREDLHDYGIIADTVESSINWSSLHKLHKGVREVIKNRPNTICLTHASHFYPQGTNLYFVFIATYKNIDEYKKFLGHIIKTIQYNGGSPSHHHGVGKMFAPALEEHLGQEQMNILKALKHHFDPNNILNPGGQMGLDELYYDAVNSRGK